MRQKTNLILVVLIGTVIFFSACKKKSSVFTVIPEDTKAVMVIDIKNMLKKSDFVNIKDYGFFTAAMNEVENESKELAELLEETVSDPTKSGINPLGASFLYFVNEGDDEQFVVFALPVTKAEKFEGWLQEIFDAFDEDFDVDSKSGYTIMVPDNDVALAWNDDAALFVVAVSNDSDDNLEDMVENLMTLDKKDQISANKEFMDFFGKKKDISFWIDYSILEDIDEYKQAMSMMSMDFDDMQLSAFVDFRDGEINVSAEVNMPDDSEIAKIYDANFNSDILKYSPDKTFGMMTYAFNTEGLNEYLNNIPTISFVKEGLKDEIGYTLDEVLESFGGSMLINLYGFDTKEVEYTDYELVFDEGTGDYDYEEVTKTKEQVIPGGVIAMDLNDSKVLKTLLDKINESGMLEEKDDYYYFEEDGMTFYFGFNDEVLVFTLDEETIESYADGGFSKNLSNIDEGKNAKNSAFYMKLNLNLADYPQSLTDMIVDEEPQAQLAIDLWNEVFSYVEMTASGKNKSEMSVVLQEDKENSLTFLLHKIDEITKKFL